MSDGLEQCDFCGEPSEGKCSVCGQDIHGFVLLVVSKEARGELIIILQGSPDQDWICCDSCNAVWCHHCATHHETGYCDECIEKYDLYSSLNITKKEAQ